MDVCNIDLFHRAMVDLPRVSNDVKIIWIKLIKKQIILLTRFAKNSDHGQKLRIQTNVGHLKRYKLKLQTLLAPKGSGLQIKRSNRVRWEDVQSAFQSRIRTGLVINLKHIDLGKYLEDAFYLIKSRLKNALKRHSMFKGNTVFCGQFIKKSGDTEILDFKYFQRKTV
ncbi:hypothetical protein HHI36_006791 [Cryptolaemus montrouzieri]|uniref:Uncharacterized protein n=1 Tax=Cryptolaemus montrouzieri TaxID=559131 RepID=A0ABD2NYF4_9CUCU